MKKILLTALLGVISQLVMAQGIRISGTLSDNDGPIMMANVVEVDANNRIVSAAQTDFDGNFSMTVRSTKNKLKFSYVGDKTQVLSIGDRTVFKVKLQPENTQLKEVVVKSKRSNSGGLMISKKAVTVAQQSMNMENIEGLSFTSADEALQGEIAGLDIVANSGNLGSGTQMRLRGVATITGNANPLIVVDDKEFENPDENFDFANANEEQYASLLSVSVDDIASIDVLKDAAAKAIYGSKGANGVLIIKTKRGSRGKPRVNFQYKLKGTWQPDGYKLLNGDEYSMLMKEEFYNPSQRSDATTNIEELNYNKSWSEFENWNNNTDWVKAVKQFGPQHEFTFGLTGGGQKASFRISAGYKNQTGSVIEQKFQQFTTRLVLDYNVSDRIRFSTNFPLTYTDNDKNYVSNLIDVAQKMAPNMSIYRQDANGNDTGDFYVMNPSQSGRYPADGNYSSYELRAIKALNNPVALAHQAWSREKTFRLTPDFSVKYELLGVESDKSRLTFNGMVAFDIFAGSYPSYWPASLASDAWNSSKYNLSTNRETNSIKTTGRVQLDYTPAFKNKDWMATMYLRYEMSTNKYTAQNTSMNNLPTGITSPTEYAWLAAMGSSNSRSASQYALYNGHLSYKDDRYNLGFSLRADGNSKFGPKHKWQYYPSVSVGYNISDEPFFKDIKGNWLSRLGLRASWGLNGNAPSSNYLFYNQYVSGVNYGSGGISQTGAVLNVNAMPTYYLKSLKLDNLKPEKVIGYNFGANLELFEERLSFDLNVFLQETRDMLMSPVAIPSMVGFSSLSTMNVGRMTNNGWELTVSGRRLVKVGKFSMDFSFNVSQTENLIKEMEPSVLESLNTLYINYTSGRSASPWNVAQYGQWPMRIQLNNSLGSIYGYHYKGVYNMGYAWLENIRKEENYTAEQYEAFINGLLAGTLSDEWYAEHRLTKRPYTVPVARKADGTVLMDEQGRAQRVKFNYVNNNGAGSETYEFDGGDAIYEDVNSDGQINELDVMYLGNCLPKVQGGFSFTFRYGPWKLVPRFNYRFGNKVINLARQNLEKMYDTYNQCATVNYRWRKDGDVTPIPRAMYNTAYNVQSSDRFVEDAGFVRFQNLQVSYAFDSKKLKKIGLNQLSAYFSMDNLYVWTKYSGVDPEIGSAAYGVAADYGTTPRSKSFTFGFNLGF